MESNTIIMSACMLRLSEHKVILSSHLSLPIYAKPEQ